MNEDKSARYHRLRRSAQAASLAWAAFALGILVLAGGASYLRDLSVSLVGRLPLSPALGVWLSLTIFVSLVAAILELGRLPLAFYRGHLLERRYGLSIEPAGAWLRQHAKGSVVGLVLAWVAAAIVGWTMRRWPESWWLVSAAVLSLGAVLLAQIAPVVVLPLFYRFEPISRDTLRARLLDLAGRAGARVLDVYEWKLGERSTTANAALVGLNPTRRILLSDTLLAGFTDDEIEIVLAHELAHHVHRDLWKSLAFEMGLVLASLFAAAWTLERFGNALGLQGPGDIASLALVLAVSGVSSMLTAPLANSLSRRSERRADRFALDLTGKPEAFQSAMRRLGVINLAEERPSRAVTFLFSTHPPIAERVEVARQWRPGLQTQS